jgi:hypothetical protein
VPEYSIRFTINLKLESLGSHIIAKIASIARGKSPPPGVGRPLGSYFAFNRYGEPGWYGPGESVLTGKIGNGNDDCTFDAGSRPSRSYPGLGMADRAGFNGHPDLIPAANLLMQ